MAFIRVRHNIEVAHRLYEMSGKCQAIHGHSMWAELTIHGLVNSNGVLDGLEFGSVKKAFRGFLDETFDHHLLLNEKDPWAGQLVTPTQTKWVDDASKQKSSGYSIENMGTLPGLMVMPGDPTTENIAKWIAEWAKGQYGKAVDVLVHETAVNAAGYHMR